MLRCRRVLLALAIMVATPSVAAAQGTGTPTSPSSDQDLLKPEQLDALVAPIALYPDALLANMLAASTYPLEVVEADRWLAGHKSMKGDQLKTEVDKRSWDDSVKALASTPTVLAMMSEKLDWTRSLGDAVLAQQPDVMDAIQRLRSRAQANNKLASTKEQKVTVQQQQGKQVIAIEPTDPNTMYVPYYEPAAVYGDWPYPDYPPYYFGTPSYIGAGVIAAGIAFGAGFALGRWSNYWRGGCNWGNNNFFINRTNNIGNNWQHNPAHRQGVRYGNAGVQQRFGNNNLRAGSADRMDFRGRGGQQVLNPGKDRTSAGNRSGGERAGAGDRPGGDRAKASDRRAGDRGAGKQAGAGNRGASKQARAADRGRGSGGAGRSGRNSAFAMQSGRAANLQSARGRASFASTGISRGSVSAGGGFHGGGGGRGGGGFRGGGGGGGRRSDLALKHDVVQLGYLDNGLGYYRFSYLGSNKAYVGVIAQEVQSVMPGAVTRGTDGYLRVDYHRLGIKFRTYEDWLAAGARIPR
jgi:uncharacterized protein DUF3300/endosialidase-like protein